MREYLKLDLPDEDGALQTFIEAATDTYQRDTGWQLMRATYDYVLHDFPWGYSKHDAVIQLPKPPLVSITSVTYLADTDGASTVLSSSLYRVVTGPTPGFIEPEYNQTWPSVRNLSGAITIRFVCGFADAANVPQHHRQAVKFLAAHLYENRNIVTNSGQAAQLPWSYQAMVASARIKEVA